MPESAGPMNPTPAWLDGVARRARRLRDRLGPRWVVAVSGGGDSVALLRALHGAAAGAGLDLSVAHLDHGTRGDAAAEDARFVAGLAADLGLPADLGRWGPTRRGHFEADARRARYAWLVEVARGRGASVVAAGHTRDDQAETVLHRILRGTGPRGLAGIPGLRRLDEGVTLARPLLDVGRDGLRAYLVGLGQGWSEDASNLDRARSRARLRHDLLPALAREFNPAVAEALARLGGLTRAAVAAMDAYVEAIARGAARPADGGRRALDRSALVGLSPYLRAEVLRSVWRAAGWPESAMDARRWRRLAALVARGEGRSDVGAGVGLELTAGLVVLSRPVGAGIVIGTEPTPDPVPLPIPGSAGWRGGRVVATLGGDPPGAAVAVADRLDLDRIALPLVVDAPRPGDRFDPLGLDGRTMPLADFLRGRKVPRADRPRVPLVRDAIGIVWVVGHRLGHRARLTEGTRAVVGLGWIEGESSADDADERR